MICNGELKVISHGLFNPGATPSQKIEFYFNVTWKVVTVSCTLTYFRATKDKGKEFVNIASTVERYKS